jgi:hypothetical protein
MTHVNQTLSAFFLKAHNEKSTVVKSSGLCGHEIGDATAISFTKLMFIVDFDY